MRKAFTFLTSSLSNIKFSSEEAKPCPPDTQKEDKSQTTTSNTKNEKSSQSKTINKNPTKINDDNNRIKKNNSKKNNSNDFKKLDSTPKSKNLELTKKQSSRRKTSRTNPHTTVSTSHSSPSRRNKLSLIKNGDSDSSDSDSKIKSNNNEEEGDDDDIPLGLNLRYSQSISSNNPSSSPKRNQEYHDDDPRIRNVSGMLLRNNHSMTQDSNTGRHHSPRRLSQYSPPVPTTPPLTRNSRKPRPHYFGERRFSSSASSSSSTSVDSSGSRYYRNSNNNNNSRNSSLPYWNEYEYRNSNNSRNSSLPYWNEYEYDDYIHYNHHQYYDGGLYDDYDEHRIISIPNGDISPNTPTLPPIERIRRISLNNLPPRSRNNSFSASGLTTTRRSNDYNGLATGANPPNRYQKDDVRKMSTAEYHRYQQEMVTAQYLKRGISPIIDDSVPNNSELLNNTSRMDPTSTPPTRPKRSSMIDRCYSGNYSNSGSNTPLVRRTSYTRTTSDYSNGAGSGNEINNISNHRRTYSESNVLQQQISFRSSARHHHYYYKTPLHFQKQFHHSATSLSSGSTYVSSSSGPPTPTGRSGMMFSSNVNSNRSSTPSSVGSGYIDIMNKAF